MAVDEVLLETADQLSQATLRFYRWQHATLSLGYFQPAARRHGHRPSLSCPMVRRASGGGALVHHHEWTYSFAIPQQPRGDSAWLYGVFHESMAQLVSAYGVKATTHPPGDAARSDQPFLCFQRRSRGDLLIGDTKVMGSAQRRRRQAVLQHGSFLLRRSENAPELPGLEDLGPAEISGDEIVERWQRLLEGELNVVFRSGELTEDELQRSDRLSKTKYGDVSWNLKR